MCEISVLDLRGLRLRYLASCVVRSAHNITGLPPAAIWKLRPGCDYTVWLPVPPLSLLMNGQPSRWHSVVDGTLT